MSTDIETESEKADPLSIVLATMQTGLIDQEAGNRLAEVVAAVRRFGRGGEIVVKLTVAPANKNNADLVRVTPKITAKAPQEEMPGSFYWPDDEGRLHRNDPRKLTKRFDQAMATTRNGEPT